METLAEPRAARGDQRIPDVGQDGEQGLRPIFRIGGWAAVAVIVLVVANGVLLIFYPIPGTVLGHFQQIQDNKLVGLANLDLAMLASEVLAAAVYVALYAALRRASQVAVTLATGVALGGIVLYVAVNPDLSFLYLSDQYAEASSAAQRASLLTAGEAVWANYQGTAFAVSYLMGAVATLVFASVMLRSRVFNRPTAWAGIVTGVAMLVPPIPAFGTVGVAIASVSLLPMVVFEALVAWRLLHLARRRTAV